MTDQDIEIKAVGADVAPRVTMADIEAAIASEHYFTAADGIDGSDIQRMRAENPDECLTLDPLSSDPDITKTSVIGPHSRLTFCILTLRNGYTLVGKSACVSAENFNAEIGRKVAREDAINHAWPLFGFSLAEDIYRTNQPDI